MVTDIQIVDRGRGPQLSTCRITVQDVFPYLQRELSIEQILEIMPALSVEEIRVVERYVQDNLQAVMEEDRRIRARSAAREDPPEIEEILHRGGEKMAALREQFERQKRLEANGDHAGR